MGLMRRWPGLGAEKLVGQRLGRYRQDNTD
jgi:hypothetical protein